MSLAPMRRAGQAGLTMIELLVAMTMGLLVTIVALSTLVMGRTGYNAVDSNAQLIDKERFAADLISRVVLQAGYEDHGAPVLNTRAIAARLGGDPEPDVFAWNNAVYAAPAGADPLRISQTSAIVDGNRPGACGSGSDTACHNGSDVLVVRFQGSSVPGGTAPDMSMINCSGQGEASITGQNLDTRAVSFFHVARSPSGEPALYCAFYDRSTSAYRNVPLLEGVESLQVLFGTDGGAGSEDTIADQWRRANQLKLSGDPVGTRANFRRVRAIRIGLVLRGPVGSAQERITASLAPLGTPFIHTDDTGSQLNVAADGRLRRVATFTVHLRGDLRLSP